MADVVADMQTTKAQKVKKPHVVGRVYVLTGCLGSGHGRLPGLVTGGHGRLCVLRARTFYLGNMGQNQEEDG